MSTFFLFIILSLQAQASTPKEITFESVKVENIVCKNSYFNERGILNFTYQGKPLSVLLRNTCQLLSDEFKVMQGRLVSSKITVLNKPGAIRINRPIVISTDYVFSKIEITYQNGFTVIYSD